MNRFLHQVAVRLGNGLTLLSSVTATHRSSWISSARAAGTLLRGPVYTRQDLSGGISEDLRHFRQDVSDA